MLCAGQACAALAAGRLSPRRRSWLRCFPAAHAEDQSAGRRAINVMADPKEAAMLDVVSQQLFAIVESFPRFKDLALDPLRPLAAAALVPGRRRGHHQHRNHISGGRGVG